MKNMKRRRSGVPGRRLITNRFWLRFRHSDGSRGAHFYAAFAPQALVFVDYHGFLILHFEHARGTYVDALFIAGALIGIDFDSPAHYVLPPLRIKVRNILRT